MLVVPFQPQVRDSKLTATPLRREDEKPSEEASLGELSRLGERDIQGRRPARRNPQGAGAEADARGGRHRLHTEHTGLGGQRVPVAEVERKIA